MLFILLVIAAIIFAIWFAIEICYTIPGTVAASIGLSVIAFLIALLLFVFSGLIISTFCDIEYVETNSYDIVALKDNSTAEGHTHFLGSSHFEGKMQYVYLIENENGKIKMETIEAEDAELTISNDVTPHVIVKEARFANGFMNFLLSDASIWYENNYDIYIPEGSIDYSYDIDLE